MPGEDKTYISGLDLEVHGRAPTHAWKEAEKTGEI